MKKVGLWLALSALLVNGPRFVIIFLKVDSIDIPKPMEATLLTATGIATGLVLTGGGGTLKGLVELFEAFFQKPCKLGFPRRFCKMDSSLIDPKFSTALGLLLEETSKNHKIYKEIWFFNKFKTKMKEFFLDIF